jgi:hypothetical protein
MKNNNEINFDLKDNQMLCLYEKLLGLSSKNDN